MRYRQDMIVERPAFAGRDAFETVGKSSDKIANGVLSGYAWDLNAIRYSFPDSKADYSYKRETKHDFAPVNKHVAEAVRQILDKAFGTAADDGFSVEGFTNLRIREGSDKGAELRFAKSSKPDSAYAYLPTGQDGSGDVWFGSSWATQKPVVGFYNFMTVIHETGHALGLKHGHSPESAIIKTLLTGKFDSLEYSVMTYHSFPHMKVEGYANEPVGYPQTFMMADIRALQHMYGADYSTNSGDTVYSWSPNSGNTLVNGEIGIEPGENRIFATIWDGGGTDTYDLSAYSHDLSIDLRPGRYSTFRDGQLADLNQFNGRNIASGNIYNALLYKGNERSLIENAIGGSGDDKLRGNGADNVLTGHDGADIFFFRTGSGSDTIADFTSGDRVNLIGMKLDFADIQAMGSDSGGDFVIDFGNGKDVLTLTGVTEASLEASDFILA